jgi:hypothetical protein
MIIQSVTEKPTKKQEGNFKIQWEIKRRNEKMKKGKYRGKNISFFLGGEGGGNGGGREQPKKWPK